MGELDVEANQGAVHDRGERQRSAAGHSDDELASRIGRPDVGHLGTALHQPAIHHVGVHAVALDLREKAVEGVAELGVFLAQADRHRHPHQRLADDRELRVVAEPLDQAVAVGEGGVDLAGGDRQRQVVARLVLNDGRVGVELPRQRVVEGAEHHAEALVLQVRCGRHLRARALWAVWTDIAARCAAPEASAAQGGRGQQDHRSTCTTVHLHPHGGSRRHIAFVSR